MNASYILGLIKQNEEIILSIPSTMQRMEKVIEITRNAPIPPNIPNGLEFFETLNVESNFLLQALEMYKTSGRVILIPNSFSKDESKHVTAVLNYIYELCERDVAKKRDE